MSEVYKKAADVFLENMRKERELMEQREQERIKQEEYENDRDTTMNIEDQRQDTQANDSPMIKIDRVGK